MLSNWEDSLKFPNGFFFFFRAFVVWLTLKFLIGRWLRTWSSSYICYEELLPVVGWIFLRFIEWEVSRKGPLDICWGVDLSFVFWKFWRSHNVCLILKCFSWVMVSSMLLLTYCFFFCLSIYFLILLWFISPLPRPFISFLARSSDFFCCSISSCGSLNLKLA